MPQRARPQQRSTYRARRPVRTRRATLVRNPSYREATVYTGTVTNAGTVETAPTFTRTGVVGPATVFFENATAGKTVWVQVPSGTGDLSVDFAAKTVTFAGSAVTNAVTVDSRWWTLAPGANTVRSNVAASVSHRDAYTG